MISQRKFVIRGPFVQYKYSLTTHSHNFIYSFEGKPDFSANYASGSEIRQYYSDFVNKYDLRRYIKVKQEVINATWNENKSEWAIIVKDNTNGIVSEKTCDFFINAGGILNNWSWPDLPGLHDFKGDLVHSAAWKDNLDLSGKRVGLIGNGLVTRTILGTRLTEMVVLPASRYCLTCKCR